MQKIIISADSTCDLTKDLIEKNNIKIFGLPIIKDDISYKDGFEITTKDMFQYTKETGKMIRTCAPNVAEFTDYFNSIYEEGAAIIHFDISFELSCTHANGKTAALDFEDIHLVETQTVSTGVAHFVLTACQMRDNGASADEIIEKMNSMKNKVDTSFLLDTLEYMRRGGRCSSIAALGANLLKLKPCIEEKGGKLVSGKKYRGSMKSCVSEYVKDRLVNTENIDTKRLFITHSFCDPELIESIKQSVKEIIQFDEIIVTQTGCTISVHCGPGTVGIIFIRN